MDQEHILIDEVAPPQRLDQLSAAHDHEILAQLSLEPGYGLHGVARDKHDLDRRGHGSSDAGSRELRLGIFGGIVKAVAIGALHDQVVRLFGSLRIANDG